MAIVYAKTHSNYRVERSTPKASAEAVKKRAQLDYEVNVRYLAHALDVRYAFVAEFAGVKTRVRTLAFWSGDRFIDNFEYDLAGTPCEAVLAGVQAKGPGAFSEGLRLGGDKGRKLSRRSINGYP